MSRPMSEHDTSSASTLDDAFATGDPAGAALALARFLEAASEAGGARSADAEHDAVQRLRQSSAATVLGALDLTVLEALVDRCLDRLDADPPALERRREAWDLLDVVRRPAVAERIAAAGETEPWAARMLRLVERSHFTVGELFAHRAMAYSGRTLLRLPGRGAERSLSWHQVAGRVDLVARGLLAITEDGATGPVAILSENRLEMALVDLACLSTGLVDVMLPATSSENDVSWVLRHCGAGTVVLSSQAQLAKVLACRDRLPAPPRLVALDPEPAAAPGIQSFEALLEAGSAVPTGRVSERRDGCRIDDLATLMYTSGTTGVPKGVTFSHRNIVFKRFARGLAVPFLGEDDSFLAYLPLFHTFGRYLELMGAIFWGATYCFAENPAIETLVRHLQEERPTVFISIPMRWVQLYERVRQEADPETAPAADVAAAVARLTGGRLRWGLSAAGYLDPEVFRFFQRHGIDLASGFGMTEATGGITMTPHGRYRDDSLGVPLPGIETGLAEDGELLIRGPYVTPALHDPVPGDDPFDDEGWLHTGDLMERDAEGHFRIIDRKKEIYKNARGQTVAPQKIENLFRDFESVGRIFLVGDHREYNTALIWPKPNDPTINLRSMPEADLRGHFRSLVVSANSFLAPFERIVDFAILPRDLTVDHGELTPKGTYRRKTVERNFAEQIRQLYRGSTLLVGGVEVVVPNWLLQALGLTAQDFRVRDGCLAVDGGRLEIHREEGRLVRVGPVRYRSTRRNLDLGALLSTPSLWVGNEALVAFAPLDPERRRRGRHTTPELEWVARTAPFETDEAERRVLREAMASDEVDLLDVHRAALLLHGEDAGDALLAVEGLQRLVRVDDPTVAEAACTVLRRAVDAAHPAAVRRAFEVLVVDELDTRAATTLSRFLDHPSGVLDPLTIAALSEHQLEPGRLEVLVAEAVIRGGDTSASARQRLHTAALADLLSAYGIAHPSQYARLRAVLTRLAMEAVDSDVRQWAAAARRRLEAGFRSWLGPVSRIAVDPETGLEYRWRDVVAFSDEVPPEARERLLTALSTAPVLREAIFLFAGGASVRLSDVLPGGVWIRLLGASHGKSVFRAAVRTRGREQYDLAINLNQGLDATQVSEEVDWLVVCSEDRGSGPLVESFGGLWAEHDLWTEEFIPGETLDRALRREARRGDVERFRGLWAWAAWSALAAYVDFWDRTGRGTEVADPEPANVIVPMHDYHAGARLVSITARRPHNGAAALLVRLEEGLVTRIEREHPELAGAVGWDTLFSAVLEVLGEAEGVRVLSAAAADPLLPGVAGERLDGFLAGARRHGFMPSRLYFAVQRYLRWLQLNPEATPEARAATMAELEATYGLARLAAAHPEVRARFFLATVLGDAPASLSEGLEAIITRLRGRELPLDGLSAAVADLRARLDLEPAADAALARLSFPYLRPGDEATWIAARVGGGATSDLVVTLEDADGECYHIRHALSPKEIGRLHRLFVAANLDVSFRPEHRFLVAVSDRGHLIGGLFYDLQPDSRVAHMDKVVVAEHHGGRGIGAALIEELCNRLRAAGCRSLTTGFFRPEFFYRLGFTIERRYAGLVRPLIDAGDAQAP